LSEIPLNKFEKKNKVIELHKQQGKTIRQIAPEVHMSFRDISKIIKAYEKKIRLQQNKKEDNNQSGKIKKPSLSSRAFKLFSEGKKPTEVVIELDIPPEKVEKFWYQFLKSERMEECYDFFQQCQYDIPTMLSINNFIKRNNISGNNIANVLREANDVNNLKQTFSNLKAEIEKLKQTKNNYSLNKSTNYLPQLLPLGLPTYYYGY
jgi:hypothetical protein